MGEHAIDREASGGGDEGGATDEEGALDQRRGRGMTGTVAATGAEAMAEPHRRVQLGWWFAEEQVDRERDRRTATGEGTHR
jgi:hypothetical protein